MNEIKAFERDYPMINGVLELAARWLRKNRAAAAARNEFSACDPMEAERIACDLGTSVSGLIALSAMGPDAAAELPRMLAALGIDTERRAGQTAGVLREMQRLCANCGEKGQCRHALAAGTAAQNYHAYCPSAYTLEALTQA